MRVSGGFLICRGSYSVDALLAAAVAGSLLTWAALRRRSRHTGTMLSYEPRRDVPWEPVQLFVFFSCSLLLLVLVSGLTRSALGIDASAQWENLDPIVKTRITATTGLAELLAVCAGVLLLVFTAGASATDLGLPTNLRTLASDLCLGVLAFMAVTLPVYMLKLLTVGIEWLFWRESIQHPIVKMLHEQLDPQTMVAAYFAAVVAAPIFEEFSFRLVLQGWLEKLDHRLRRQAAAQDPIAALAEPLAEAPAKTLPETPPALPPWRSLPVLTSSLLFAMMHIGNGLDPIPLFVLGLALGYLYQRTHRLLPCILLHALFNGFSLGVLWFALKMEPNAAVSP